MSNNALVAVIIVCITCVIVARDGNYTTIEAARIEAASMYCGVPL